MKTTILVMAVLVALGCGGQIDDDDSPQTADRGRPAPVLTMAEPREAGMSAAGLNVAEEMFVKAVAEDRVLGYQLLVARRGKVVLHTAGGLRDIESRLPMTTGTLLNMASMNKSVAAVGILKLVDQGRLGIDDRVALHLSGFDSEESGEITIRQLLLHTAGYTDFEVFCDGLTPESPTEPTAPSLIVEARELGARGPDEEPGSHFRYNNLGYNVLGAIIESKSGMKLDEYLRQTILEPLEMNSTYFDTETFDHRNSASQYWFMNKVWEKLETGGIGLARANAGIISTAWDFSKFCQMLINGGSYGHQKVLDPATVALATSPLIEVPEAYLPLDVETAMGLESEWYEYRDRRSLAVDTHRGLGFVVSETGAYSHAGIYGTFFLVDPERELVILILTQSIYGGNPGQAFIEAVTSAVVESR